MHDPLGSHDVCHRVLHASSPSNKDADVSPMPLSMWHLPYICNTVPCASVTMMHLCHHHSASSTPPTSCATASTFATSIATSTMAISSTTSLNMAACPRARQPRHRHKGLLHCLSNLIDFLSSHNTRDTSTIMNTWVSGHRLTNLQLLQSHHLCRSHCDYKRMGYL